MTPGRRPESGKTVQEMVMNQHVTGANRNTFRGLHSHSPTVPIANQVPSFWLWVMCLLGVDYFSSLGYQPSLTYELAGPFGPIATLAVVLVTLLIVLPLYLYMARKSPHGEGAVAVLERLVVGWRGKTLILIVLGFAATDFVMLRSISLSDAAEHVRYNSYIAAGQPLEHLAVAIQRHGARYLGKWLENYVHEQVLVSVLLGTISFFFWYWLRRGFNRHVIQLAAPLVGSYLLLNGIVILSGLLYLHHHPELTAHWWDSVQHHVRVSAERSWIGTGWPAMVLLGMALVPQLSLGLSGFELSMILMPQVAGSPGDDSQHPRGRIRHTWYMLGLSALLMSGYLLGAVTVITILIPSQQFDISGQAGHRALAYLAHGGPLTSGLRADAMNPLFGPAFGTLYDLSSVLILCFAGSSVMTALSTLMPRILLRFGMELEWAQRWGVMFSLFALVNMVVTVVFRANVDDQRGAYATGVLALILTTSLVAIADWRKQHPGCHRWYRFPWHWGCISLLFAVMLLTVILVTPSGLLISTCFISVILATSVVSRAVRTGENRTIGFDFVDDHSRFLWHSLRLANFPVLVPHRPGLHNRQSKEKAIRADHHLDPKTEIVFLEVGVDDPSNFYQTLLIEVAREDQNFVVKVRQCASVPHAIAAIALEMSRDSRPPGLHFGWSELGLLAASWSYWAFGEGNVPWKVRELIMQGESDPEKRPRVVVG